MGGGEADFFHLWTASGFVSDSHGNVLCNELYRTELSGNTQLALGLDEYQPLTRAQTTSSGRKATALGTASGKGRSLWTLFFMRQRRLTTF